MWKQFWEEFNSKIYQDKELYIEFTTSLSDGNTACELIVVGEDVEKVENAISSVRKVDGSVKECIVSTDAMGVKILNEGLKSGKMQIQKELIYHIEAATRSIIIVSPYCMQAEEVHKTIEEYISSEKEKRKIITKSFTLKYPFLTKTLKLDWIKVQEIAKSHRILSINLVTNPRCAIEVKGKEEAINQAESEILQYI